MFHPSYAFELSFKAVNPIFPLLIGHWMRVAFTTACSQGCGQIGKVVDGIPGCAGVYVLLGVRKARLPLEEWELLYGETLDNGTKTKVSKSKVNGDDVNRIKNEKMIDLDPATVILH